MDGMQFDAKGILFDGSLDERVTQGLRQGEREVADLANQMLHREFGARFKHPTGRYAGRVQVVRMGSDWKVWDGRSVYGPWLEGTGSRNKTTRFKGYTSFRRVTQQVQARATGIVESAIDKRIGGA